MTGIDTATLAELNSLNRRLGIKRNLKSIGYERSAELPYIIALLRDRFSEPLRLLDIGSGDSIWPTYLLCESKWDVTCLDRYDWVEEQRRYMRRLGVSAETAARLHVVKEDLFDFQTEVPFDVITSISVVEHFSGASDTAAMRRSSAMLRSGGIYVLTTPVNDGHFREFYRRGEVYGAHGEEETFYQRHYDVASLQSRLIAPSGLSEMRRVYFGEYGYPFGEKFIFPRLRSNPLKVFYRWLSPAFARRFVSYSERPVSRAGMSVDTASGVILALTKP
ncbi:MAG: methyltransferase domain-containing protein [Burkholderiales bacterium]|nr:methyltransferase domain-containing protein [Burkholderiales bacterium]